MSAATRSTVSGDWAESAFVKPLTGSRGDFAQAVHGEAALVRYLDDVVKYYDAVLIQPIVEGIEYRVFLLDDDVLYCARKYPPSVTGDGVHTVRELLAAHNDTLRARGLSPALLPDRDPSLDAVPAKGERRDIPGRMNLSAGGTMVLADAPSEKAITLARQAARAIGLRVAAIDMFVDIGGKSGCKRDHRGQLQPVDPAAGRFQSRRPHSENLASQLRRHGAAVMFDLPKYGDGICLARLAALLEALAIDRARLQRISVVVTGSNGKGSTAAICAAIGRAYGLRTGLFTSPHLFRFNERIQVDGVEIGDDVFARLKLQVEAAIAEVSKRLGEKFGAFEALFALACLHFQEQPMRLHGVRGRHRRALRSGPPDRRARDMRHLGRLRARRTARQLARIDRIRQE